MRAKLTILPLLTLAALLTACSPKVSSDGSANSATNETPATAMSDMSGMTMTDTAKTGSGTGVITAIDKAAGTLTIKHEAIPAVDWPAMTMAFKATPPSLLDTVKVGQKITFDVTVAGSEAQVTVVHPE